MDSFEYNKLIGAFLGTCFILFSISLVSDGLFSSPNPAKPGFAIKADAPAAGAAGAPKANPAEQPIAPLMAKASPKNGQEIFKRCQACHDGTKGGPNKIGPNLWGVLGRPIASHPGYSYSAAMKKFSNDSKNHWTYQLISEFIYSPRDKVPGTAMGFAGLKDIKDRADVLSYVRTLSDSPEPLPKPEAPKKAAAKAPAKGGAAPANGAAKPATATPANSAAKPANGASTPAAPANGAAKSAAPANGNAPASGAPANGAATDGTAKPAPAPAK